MSSSVHDVLRYPFLTEKSIQKKDESGGRVLTFQVRRSATKGQIKEAVERIFEVRVDRVRTANFGGKIKRQGRYSGRRPAWKKAYVTLKEGEKQVEFFEGF